jgi:hypothetical protein
MAMPDMLIGAATASPGGRPNAGSVFVVFGQALPFNATLELSSLNGANGFRLNGVSFIDYAGSSLGSADINGDGRPDMLIGAYYASPEGRSRSYAGSVFVVFGQSSPFNATLELSSLNGSNGFRLNGVSANDFTGYSLASADINCDGRVDMLIGAQQASPGGRSQAGAAYVIYGDKIQWLNNQITVFERQPVVLSSNHFSVSVTRLPQQISYRVSNLQYAHFEYVAQVGGPINSFSYSDIANQQVRFVPDGSFTAPSFSITASHTLASSSVNAVVNFTPTLQTFPPVFELSTLNGFNGFTLNGVAADDQTGWSLGVADINGDGLPDMLIGAYNASPGGRSQAGSVFVVFGQASPFNATVELSALTWP